MTPGELIGRDGIAAALRVGDKPQLLRELSQRAARLLSIDAETVLDALETREALGSTGIGRGIALPHARLNGLRRFFGMFARLERPIDFDAIDGQAVDLVFLLLVPEHAVHEQLAALASVSRLLRDKNTAASLRAAATAAEIYDILAAPTPGQ